MNTVKLTASQALVRYLYTQQVEPGVPYIAGVWAIFGHGNVAGLASGGSVPPRLDARLGLDPSGGGVGGRLPR